jgi:hypothetical protein
MKSVKYGSNAEDKKRQEFLNLIPAPDEVFLAAARRAVIVAGLSDEAVEMLHAESEPESSLR